VPGSSCRIPIYGTRRFLRDRKLFKDEIPIGRPHGRGGCTDSARPITRPASRNKIGYFFTSNQQEATTTVSTTTSAPTRLPDALSIEQAADLLGVPASRFNASWRQNRVAVPYQGQVSRQSVVRAFVLLRLQRLLGDSSPLALEIARGLNDPTLDRLLEGALTDIAVRLPGGVFTVVIPRDVIAELREQLAALVVAAR
jgi:hypothetical protein